LSKNKQLIIHSNHSHKVTSKPGNVLAN